MSIEKALIVQAKPHIIAAMSKNMIQKEVVKGCNSDISNHPVHLEPYFTPLWRSPEQLGINDQPLSIPDQITSDEDLNRFQVWISPDQEFDWNQSEHFIKQQQMMSHRGIFQIIGNNEKIILSFFCHKFDVPILSAAFRGTFQHCELTKQKDGMPSTFDQFWGALHFREFFPSPPYSHLLTRPDELRTSPLIPLISVLNAIHAPSAGIYQIIYQPVSPNHNWHRNVQKLLDLEFIRKQHGQNHIPQRFPQQAPSGDLHQMAWDVENKAHNDKPFYVAVFRLGIICEEEKSEPYLDALSTFAGMFQHGGRPLRSLDNNDYAQIINPSQFEKMFLKGITYRPGFLLNSQELTGLIHLPPANSFDVYQTSIELLETLPVREQDITTGTWIGNCEYAGESIRVCLPKPIRKRHTHIIGRPDMGKSTTEEHIILSDIEQEEGVAVFDPHGDLIERLLCLIPERHIERTIYLNPGDPNWVPIWNPLKRIPGQDIGRTADVIVQAIQSFVSPTGWGDRLEHLFRNMIYSLIHLPKGTFFDIANLLQNKSESEDGKKLRKQILQVVENETVRRFWLHDYHRYGKDDLGPPKNKLSKLLVSNTVSLMLSQPDSLFNFRQIMDKGMILLINLSTIGPMARSILGCFILSLLHLTALSRSNIPIAKRKQFHIHCDEAHRFTTDSLEELIAETRKYGVSLSLAHQYMSQFGKRKTDAFSSVGSTIIFNVDSRDANYLIKDLQKKVKLEDIIILEKGEAIARIGTEIVRFKTRPPLKIPKKHFRDKIISESRKKYYRPTHEVKKQLRCSNDRWAKPITPLTPFTSKDASGEIKEFKYDEF
ncbi:MAG: type IV secretion system DNA-binding domain-containing protein [Desulfobacteraceae bacterium]|nr:type IV secretion system DNA-binding domain-containing protein [Desulfobacteraceae bacterium]MBC2755147.1 type IV secretion system DNA-binding domain-containing protein [Desulfobacteraceae bacterium]